MRKKVSMKNYVIQFNSAQIKETDLKLIERAFSKQPKSIL
jgi:hypothetical protein